MKTIALAASLLILAGAGAGAGTEAPAPTAQAPNILFILVDDFGWRDLGSYGSSLYETPRMDQLAAAGVRFTQAYASYPRCVPSRFAMMTGKAPVRFQGSSDGLRITPGRDRTIGQAFQAGGYTTFYAGKWHLGEGENGPKQNGFAATFAAGAAGATGSHFAPYNTSRRGGGGGGGGGDERGVVPDVENAPEGEYLSDRLTAETAKWIRAHKDQPFFAVLAHYAVHTPLEGKDAFVARYREKLKGQKLPEQVWEKESAGENLTVQNNPTYAAMIQSADESVGTLLDLLDELKIASNTIVVLTSDHGGLSARGNNRQVATSNRPLRAGKGHLYEGGLRVPLIVRWPGAVKAGTVLEQPVIGADLFPTFLEMAGLPLQPNDHIDGRSWAGALRGSQRPAARTLFWHNPAPRPVQTADWFSSALRDGDLKLVEFPDTGRVELYDVNTDVGEARNLTEQRPDDTRRLVEKLRIWQKETGAASPGARNRMRRERP